MELISKLINILDKFFEKYFIPTLISIVIAFGIYLITDEKFWILLKLGKETYIVILTIIFIIIIVFIKWLYNKICTIILNEKHEKEKIKEKNDKEIYNMKRIIDNLKYNERRLLKYFIENENQEINTYANSYGNALLTNYCDSCEDIASDNISGIDINTLVKIEIRKNNYYHKYKLNSYFYNNILIIKSLGEDISNFEL